MTHASIQEHAMTFTLACMQGHIDMVCEKNSDVQHDFFKDALKLVKKGEWLKVSSQHITVFSHCTLAMQSGLVCAVTAHAEICFSDWKLNSQQLLHMTNSCFT